MKISSRRRNDLVLILAIILASVLMMAGFLIHGSRNTDAMLKITVGGREYGQYPLDTDRTIEIGKTNICEIRDGKVRMIYADCPDQTCVHSLPISRSGGSIICLPNRIVLQIFEQGGKTEETITTDSKPDAIAG
ncbi:MAG: NusG domain II-containing protein [Eubacterium sp.]|nr:NusG domain II-containing protein [Eubacterium sp.]